MATTFTATITNTLSSGNDLTFGELSATHGNPAEADPTTMDAGSSSVVTATPIDPVLGPSPAGTFEWTLPDSRGAFVFSYDLHASPVTFQCTATPDGYQVSTTLDDSGQATAVITPHQQSFQPVMQQIDTIVFLMLENRSLDNVLGWLYENDAPAVVYPEGSPADYDGIPKGACNKYKTTSYSPTQSTGGDQSLRVPQYDPYEPMPDVMVQLYADCNGTMPTGDVWSQTPRMQGFAYNYYAVYDDPTQVMGAYSVTQLPVLSGLARNFAVSDAWFSSVPTQTNPNRAFSVCGTSLGAEVNGDIDDTTYVGTNTIFNVLGSANKTWGVYWQSEGLGTGEPPFTWQPFTSYYFPELNNAANGAVQDWSAFESAAKNGTLPNFCYVEPYWGGGKGDVANPDNWFGIQGNDYHPPAWVGPAEADLNSLYELLTSSPQWGSMLLIITFDEHGGTYDHVPPPSCVAPDGSVGPSGFTFKRLGVRVPTIVVSPYIQAGTVFRAPSGDFDHTSFLATFCKWAGVDPASADLGARVAVAPTFEGVLSATARKDVPTFSVPAKYAGEGGGVGSVSLGAGGASTATKSGVALNVNTFREKADNASYQAFGDWLEGMFGEKPAS